MEYYKSKSGRIESRQYWEDTLNAFWETFNIKGSDYTNLPKRPADAWERFKRRMDLQLYDM